MLLFLALLTPLNKLINTISRRNLQRQTTNWSAQLRLRLRALSEDNIYMHAFNGQPCDSADSSHVSL
jgi:hypothetical protein